MSTNRKADLLQKRRWRIRKKVKGTAARPRLAIRFTGKHAYAQAINDDTATTLVFLSSLDADLRKQKLAANLAGGFVIGVAAEYFLTHPLIAPEWRLLITTGFLGSLTTFSTFSAEAVGLLQTQQYGWAALLIGSHLAGSLVLTVLGMLTVRWLM